MCFTGPARQAIGLSGIICFSLVKTGLCECRQSCGPEHEMQERGHNCANRLVLRGPGRDQVQGSTWVFCCLQIFGNASKQLAVTGRTGYCVQLTAVVHIPGACVFVCLLILFL